MGLKTLEKHPSFTLAFLGRLAVFGQGCRVWWERKNGFLFLTILLHLETCIYVCLPLFFSFFSDIWPARQGVRWTTPEDDKRFFLQYPSSLYHIFWTKKTKKPFLSVSLHSCTNKQYPPILRFAFISVYIIICI